MPLAISLAQWSLHRAIQSGALRAREFPRVAKEDFGIDAIELVSGLLDGSSRQMFDDLKREAGDHGVRILLIMVDDEGDLSHPRTRDRKKAIARHRRWIDAAAFLGCHAVRVNTGGRAVRWNAPLGSGAVQSARCRCLESCRDLADYAAPAGIQILLENHGGLSSNGRWLAGVMKMVNHPRCGTLPDFGNFYEYDRYQGVAEMMPFARAVSAKTHDFDAAGNETTKDYRRLLKIVLDAGYHSWIGIEYEGTRLPEREGIARTLSLLERVRSEMK